FLGDFRLAPQGADHQHGDRAHDDHPQHRGDQQLDQGEASLTVCLSQAGDHPDTTLSVRLSGRAPGVPTALTALTEKTWRPSFNFFTLTGEVQPFHACLSTRQKNLVPGWSVVSAKRKTG